MNCPIPLLPAQGLGGLTLALVCATLYVQRRRPHVLWWALSWGCFGVWAWAEARFCLPGEAGPPPAAAWWAKAAAEICLGWHAALWLFGLRRYRAAPAGEGTAAESLGAGHVLILLAAGAAALGLSALPDAPAAAVAAAALAAVYGTSAARLVRDRRGNPTAGWLALGLGLAALGQLARADAVPGAPAVRELTDAEAAAQRCADMTQSLLTFSRRSLPRPHLLDLNAALAEAARLLQRLLPPTVRVEVRAEAAPAAVIGDRTQLHQVLINLAVNARDAMPTGGTLTLATAHVVVDAAYCARNVEARPGDFLVLTVADTGTGMSPEVRGRLFEPFFTTKAVGQGTGLGLAVVYGIVKAHGGWVSVASAPGRGSTFAVYLPAAPAEAARAAEAGPPAVRGGHECVLVVDDDDMVRHLARCVLERWGFRVLTAADGEEALTTYRARGPEIDLVVLDFAMPHMTGLEVLHGLRRLNTGVRVIFASGHVDSPDSESLLTAGARAFVPKPYRPEELVRRVRQVLDEPAAEPPVAHTHAG